MTAQLAPLRRFAACLDGRRVPLNSEQRSHMQGDIPYWGANGIVDQVDDFLFDEQLVLLGEDGAPFDDPNRAVAFLVDGRVWVNNHIHVLRPVAGTDARFLTYALNAIDWMPHVGGSTRLKLTQDDMMAVKLPKPALADQRAIADHLDAETARIDALIAKKQQLIDLLELQFLERCRAMTTPLDAPVAPLRWTASAVGTGTTPSADASWMMSDDGSVEWFTPGDVGKRLTLHPAARRLDAVALRSGEVPTFPAQSTLLVGIGATAGKVAFMSRAGSSNQQMTAVVPGERLQPRF